jgi:hypothetical protein
MLPAWLGEVEGKRPFFWTLYLKLHKKQGSAGTLSLVMELENDMKNVPMHLLLILMLHSYITRLFICCRHG